MTRSCEDDPEPGDLFLDEALPGCERVTLVRNGWRAEATHVWVGAGWARLVPGPVTPVPDRAPRRQRRPAARTATVGSVDQPGGAEPPVPPRAPTIPEPTAGVLPGPAPRSALDLELSETEPRRLARSARRR